MATGGTLLVRQLEEHDIKRAFAVPGESFLAVLDALHDSPIELITTRHEGGACFMAQATAKVTGRPGVAFVTRGPGATNASCGVHAAMHDSSPLLLCVGQVARQHRHRAAFQEIDHAAFFAPLCKWSIEIDNPDRVPELVSRALHVATSGRPGPVVLALPEDMLAAPATTDPIAANGPCDIATPSVPVAYIRERIMAAKTPLVVLGGSQWSGAAARQIETFASRYALPVVTSFRRQDMIDNRCANYAGDLSAGMNPALRTLVGQSDCLLLLGTRLGDIATSGFAALTPAKARASLIHVHPDPGEPGTLWPFAMAVTARPDAVLAALLDARPSPGPTHEGWLEHCRATYTNWRVPDELPGALQMSSVVTWLSDHLPPDAILTNGAGNYAAFLHRFFQYRTYGACLATTAGAMGYGLPAAIAAALETPDRTVVCLAGDGCFQMTLNELSVVREHGCKLIILIANNGMYGTIRMHQEIQYPHRRSGTDLINPDYQTLAAAYGFASHRVTTDAEFPPAMQAALNARTTTLIELVLEPAAISTTRSLDQLRATRAPDPLPTAKDSLP